MAFLRKLIMKVLPKPEYLIMRGLMKKHGLNDPSELFGALLRLGDAVQKIDQAYINNGDKWLTEIIIGYRTDRDAEGAHSSD